VSFDRKIFVVDEGLRGSAAATPQQIRSETDIFQSFKIGSSQLNYCLKNERDVPFKYLNCSEFKYAI
jgi:hypothetical protein